MDNRKALPLAELRRRAKALAAERGAKKTKLSLPDAVRVASELEVHRIELEIQNEELRATRDEKEQASRRYAELFDFAPIGYLVLDPDGIIRACNLEARRMLRLEGCELGALRLASFVPPVERARLAEFVVGIIEDAPEASSRSVLETPLAVPGHGSMVVRLVGARVNEGAPRALVALQEVTALRRAENDLRVEAQRKDDFLSALSHELRNPLWPIRSSLALLDRVEPGGQEARAALAIVGRQVDHLVHIVDDLLDVTRIARGKIHLRTERVALGELARRAIADHRPAFEAAAVALDVAFPEDPLWVTGDPTRLIQVIGNLLSNALKFTRQGGHVELFLRREVHRVALFVRDDGVGIAPEFRERLFEPFLQAPQSLDRSRGGLGLGLAMVRGLVELHEGRVDAYSEGVGCGSEFVVRLPLADPPEEQAAPRPPRAPKAEPRRVLVIEDAQDAAEAIQELLQLEGHEVRVAYDGPRGIETAQAFHPEVVLCDIGLPGMDGYEVARAMRRDPVLRDAHLVALSGYAREEDKAQAIAAGFDRHIGKPPRFDELERVLASAPPLPAACGAEARPEH